MKKNLISLLIALTIGVGMVGFSACDLGGLTDSQISSLEETLKTQGMSLDEVLHTLKKLGYRGSADEFLELLLQEGTLEKEEIDEWKKGHNNGRGPDWNNGNGNGNSSNNGVGPNGNGKGIWVEKVYINAESQLVIELGDGTIINLGDISAWLDSSVEESVSESDSDISSEESSSEEESLTEESSEESSLEEESSMEESSEEEDSSEDYEEEVPSNESLTYSLSSDGTYYIVTGLVARTDRVAVIPDTYEGLPVISIATKAFSNCKSLTEIVIPDSVTRIGEYAFYNTAYYKDENNWEDGVLYIGKYLIKAKTNITDKYTIKDGTVCVADYAFYNCSSLTEIIISNSVTSIGEGAFIECGGLTEVVIPNSVVCINKLAFSRCSGLTDIVIPDSVTSIANRAFENCQSLTNIMVHEGNVNYSSLDGNLYNKNQTTLIQYAIGKTDKFFTMPNSVLNIEDAFRHCSNLVEVVMPESVIDIGSYAFYWCEGLTKVIIPNSVTSIGRAAFLECNNLTEVFIGRSVTSIGHDAFLNCRSLTEITVDVNNIEYSSLDGNLYNKTKTELLKYATGKTDISFIIPDGVESIADSAFRECIGLTAVVIPDSVTSISETAYYNCSGLESIQFQGTVEEWKKIKKGKTWKYNVPATMIICSDDVVIL